ncbi:MAG: hypothetical protein R3F53_15385 [Gammaproteobacteria bacterium]
MENGHESSFHLVNQRVFLSLGLVLPAGAAEPAVTPALKTALSRLSRPDVSHVMQTLHLLQEGRETFRFETFGSDTFWGDQLACTKPLPVRR